MRRSKSGGNGTARARKQESFSPENGEQLRQELDRLAAQQDDGFRQSANVVRDTFKAQLDAAGRHTPQVNDAYASMLANFFAVQAAQHGTTPEEMYARYPLTVTAEGIAGAGLNQALKSQPPKGWKHAESGADAAAMWNGEMDAEAVFFTDLQGKLQQDAPELAGYSHSVGRSTINHIRKNHGDEGAENQRGQLPATAADIARIPEIVTAYDDIRTDLKTDQGAQRLAYSKRVEDGVLVFIEDVSRKRNDMRAVSMWKYPPTVDEKNVLSTALEFGEEKAKARNPGLLDDALRPLSDYESDAQTPPSGESLPAQGGSFNQSGIDQTETPAFKRWFGDSKVVDAEGKPLVVYHGSPDLRFINEDGIFKSPHERYGMGEREGAHWFTPSQETAKTYADPGRAFDFQNAEEGVFAAYIKLENPLIIDAAGANWRDAQRRGKTSSVINEARANGHDGVIIRNVKDDYNNDARTRPTDTYVVFNSEQIKSATGNNGNFDPNDRNVLHQDDLGPFGPVLHDFKGDAQGAIAKLMEMKSGEAIGALHHPDIGDIDLVWGEEGDPENGYAGGYGLAKIAAKHPEVLDDLQGALSAMSVVRRGTNRIILESENHKAAISLNWLGAEKKWMLSAYAKEKGSTPDATIHTAEAGAGDSLLDASDSIVNQKLSDFQQRKDAARGSFNPATLQISLLKSADLSTFLHESGHFFLEVMADLAARADAPAQTRKDMEAVLAWFGVRDMAEWRGLDLEQKRPYHEQFARGFEAYLFEGKAPNIEMQGLFQRFRAWMLNVYKDLKALNVELNDDVRGVFDRMLASTEQIALAEQARAMFPLFETAEQAGIAPEDFAAYQALGTDATNEAIQQLQARGLRDMQWLHNAHGREVKRLQKVAAGLRAQEEMAVQYKEALANARASVGAHSGLIPLQRNSRDTAKALTQGRLVKPGVR